MQFEFNGDVFNDIRGVFAKAYHQIDTAGMTSKEAAEALAKFCSVDWLTADALVVVEELRARQFPAYLNHKALEAFRVRTKAVSAKLKGDRSAWAKQLRREAQHAENFARMLHIGKTPEEALSSDVA